MIVCSRRKRDNDPLTKSNRKRNERAVVVYKAAVGEVREGCTVNLGK